MAITRTPMTDDDGSGTTGTIINSAWKIELYDQIDAALLTAGGGATSGSWQPTIEGIGGASGQSYAIRDGRWTRIGNLMLITGCANLTAKGTLTGAAAVIGNLPAPVATIEGAGSVTFSFFAGFSSGVVYLGAFPRGGTSRLELTYLSAAATASSFVLVGMITDGTDLRFSGMYMTS